ncbi:MAG: methylenetetrahydrofolate reductase [Desulfatitalea sp.]|nr:methylenetetrahydrofolate reductase [Desulfatitalea sp.]NNK00573.1 methylenetetrahydrofolate reductase [Desulfatitalea sp.]
MKLKDALGKKKFVVTSEVQTPLGDDSPEQLVDRLKRIRGRVDGVSVTDVDLEGVVGDSIHTCELLEKSRFNAIYQTTTRDKNRIQLQKDLAQAHQVGIENLLVFTEDYRITGDSIQEQMFFHVDSGKLGSVLQHVREGRTIEGEELPEPFDFTLGSGVESLWGKNIPKQGMQGMEALKLMGAGFFLTTPIFDLEQFDKFMRQIRMLDVPVIAEVLLLRNAAMARFINRHFKPGLVPEWVIQKLDKATDKRQASIELFGDLAKGLKEVCNGLHIITLGGEDKLQPYLDAANLR